MRVYQCSYQEIMNKILTIFTILLLSTSLHGCYAIYDDDANYKGHYKVGKPYKINRVKYYPKAVQTYNKTGLASWYGPGFHGKVTANGETFNQRRLTAAHNTLPLPSLVKVTNLNNKKSIIVRVNDRGPFARNKRGRIIDLSERAAELLGIKKKGVARVNVKLLPSATAKLHKKLNLSKSPYKQKLAH
ncbi:MAG: septal ring lytic transglycosylase RlpA family protein [Alphaproteobacteria bacterium]|nr:septal ring lytic transglycosylase RlpA family protein [Alphaproteobacteria bacterium]